VKGGFCCVLVSVEAHVGGLGGVPAGHLGGTLQRDQVASACFENHTFFFALVQELLLATGQWVVCGCGVFLVVISPSHVSRLGADALVGTPSHKSGVHGGPGGHEKLLLVGVDIDNAVLVLHKVLEAGCGVEHWGNRHWGRHKAKE